MQEPGPNTRPGAPGHAPQGEAGDDGGEGLRLGLGKVGHGERDHLEPDGHRPQAGVVGPDVDQAVAELFGEEQPIIGGGQRIALWQAPDGAIEPLAGQDNIVGFAQRCHELFVRGSTWVDEHLFNGEYYEQIIQPLTEDQIRPGLRHAGMGARHLADPDFQLGAACLVDQLVGQFLAHVCGLGYLVAPQHARKTLRSVMKYNFRPSLTGHFNQLRSFALGDEAALLMSTYPRGRRPRKPFPYCNEVMTGFEYTAAVGMLYEGLEKDGLRCLRAIRDRYDGRRRNPFDEAECGHHYGRAMVSWAAVLALTGFHYSGVTGTMTFAPVAGTHFWSTGNAWGTCRLKATKKGWRVQVNVIEGEVWIAKVVLRGLGEIAMRAEA